MSGTSYRRAPSSTPSRAWPTGPPPTCPRRRGEGMAFRSTCSSGRRPRPAPPRCSPVDPAAHTTLDNPRAVAELLASLRRAGAHEQADTLTDRLPAVGMFGFFLKQRGLADQFRFGRKADGTPATPWGWEDLDLSLVPDRGDHEATLPWPTADPPNSQGKSGQSPCSDVRSYIAKPSSALRLLAVFTRTGQAGI